MPYTVIIGYPYHADHKNPFYSWVFCHSAAPEDGVNLRLDYSDFNSQVNHLWNKNSIYSYTTNPRSLYINGNLHTQVPGKDIQYNHKSGIRIGYDANGKENFMGDIAEIIIYNRELSEDDRHSVERYLSEKYGIDLYDQ